MSMVSAICRRKTKEKGKLVLQPDSKKEYLFVVQSVPPLAYASPAHAGEPSPSAGREHSVQPRLVGEGLVVVQAGLVVNEWAELKLGV